MLTEVRKRIIQAQIILTRNYKQDPIKKRQISFWEKKQLKSNE